MTKNRAQQLAHLTWYKPPAQYGYPAERTGAVKLRSKRVELRCEVGYHEPGRGRIVAGSGRTWEEAFAAAGISLDGFST